MGGCSLVDEQSGDGDLQQGFLQTGLGTHGRLQLGQTQCRGCLQLLCLLQTDNLLQRHGHSSFDQFQVLTWVLCKQGSMEVASKTQPKSPRRQLAEK